MSEPQPSIPDLFRKMLLEDYLLDGFTAEEATELLLATPSGQILLARDIRLRRALAGALRDDDHWRADAHAALAG